MGGWGEGKENPISLKQKRERESPLPKNIQNKGPENQRVGTPTRFSSERGRGEKGLGGFLSISLKEKVALTPSRHAKKEGKRSETDVGAVGRRTTTGRE